jgi:hypothetical protein
MRVFVLILQLQEGESITARIRNLFKPVNSHLEVTSMEEGVLKFW